VKIEDEEGEISPSWG